MRTVIYARFSSDNQNPRSTADQIAVCRERAEREGWSVVATFEDAAISGAAGVGELQRPGLNAMMQLVEAGGIDQVLAESTDRLARHVADAHTLRERIEFAGARLFTLFDGTVTPIVGLVKGFMDAQFRTDLAARVKRGQRSSVQQGRATAGIAYGYRRVLRFDDNGNPIRGLREIVDDKAEIVRRIFREYAAGRSGRQIAGDLNQEGLPAPRGAFWMPGVITGEHKSGHGILRNRLYIGEIVYGRTKAVVNPTTRARRMRPAGEQLTVASAPELRIVDQDLWEAVQQELASRTAARPEYHRRPKHLLSGLGVCGVCGNGWVKSSGENWGCRAHRNGKACTNNRVISSRQYQERVLAELRANLLAPDVVAAYVREYHRDYARKASQLTRDRARLADRLAQATRKMDRLLAALADGGSAFGEIRDMLGAAREEKERLARELASLDALPEVLTLHPRLEEEYRRQVEALQQALEAPETKLEAVPRLRAMIARIILRPAEATRGVQIEVVRQMDEVLSLATQSQARA
ncbi:recombinase family protein [Sphingomonas aracearum]|nr:recombinase family protein [Sphingomonas aracearum]